MVLQIKVTIEKNLEKIAKLEARNLSLENNKSGQLQSGSRSAKLGQKLKLGGFLKEENPKLEKQESEMFKNLGQDQSVKGEYQETKEGNTTIKSETFCSDKQIQSGSDKQIQSGSDIQIQSDSYAQIQSEESVAEGLAERETKRSKSARRRANKRRRWEEEEGGVKQGLGEHGAVVQTN